MALLIDHQGVRSRAATVTDRLFDDAIIARTVSLPVLKPAAVAPAPAPTRTLDEVLTATWDGLTAGLTATCPVCDGALAPRWSAGAGIVGGRCRDCGAELD